MTSTKYIGMDVHKESISIAVRNAVGKVVMECVIETKASMILQFITGLRGDVQVTFEEGTSAAWLYDLLKPHVTKLVVCDPRKNKSMREGNQSDKIDARRLAELLRLDPRCMRMDYFQTRVLRWQSPPPFFFRLPVPPQLFVGHNSRSPMKDWDPVRPGDDRLRNLSNGVKGPSTSTVLATMPAIASTGAMLLCGRDAPVGSRP